MSGTMFRIIFISNILVSVFPHPKFNRGMIYREVKHIGEPFPFKTNWPLLHGLVGLSIDNLNTYIRPFSGCLVHVLVGGLSVSTLCYTVETTSWKIPTLLKTVNINALRTLKQLAVLFSTLKQICSLPLFLNNRFICKVFKCFNYYYFNRNNSQP